MWTLRVIPAALFRQASARLVTGLLQRPNRAYCRRSLMTLSRCLACYGDLGEGALMTMTITRRDWWGGIAVLTAALLLNSLEGLNKIYWTYWALGFFAAVAPHAKQRRPSVLRRVLGARWLDSNKRRRLEAPCPGARVTSQICDRDDLHRLRSRAIMLGLVASRAPATPQLDATAEETMSPIARRPMPS